MIYAAARSALFRMDAERAHGLTLRALRVAGALPLVPGLFRALTQVKDDRLAVEAFGVRFANPIGLAAGYDKDGLAVRGLFGLGFGHVEIGTLTRGPQPGNTRPRLWRAPEGRALINRMGFPNGGVEAFLARPWPRPYGPVGINIGKSKDTPLNRAEDDYITLYERVAHRASYVAINISSPNTPDLRALQTRAYITDLCGAIARTRDHLAQRDGRRVSALIKVAPDLEAAALDDIVDAVLGAGLDGLIATNTTTSRPSIAGFDPAKHIGREGGLSGAPLRARATAVIAHLRSRAGVNLPIIGVGGVDDVSSAIEKLRAGANLLQVYSGLVYRGPSLPAALARGLSGVLDRGEDWRKMRL